MTLHQAKTGKHECDSKFVARVCFIFREGGKEHKKEEISVLDDLYQYFLFGYLFEMTHYLFIVFKKI